MQRIVDYLRENAGDSIQCRMIREILNVSPHTSEMKKLHKQILNKRKVRKILNTQREDGWFGNELHGVDSVDTYAWRLLNHGVEKSHSTFERVIHVLLHPKENEPYKRTFPGGPALDLDGRGGDKSVIANTLAMLDHENNEYVIEEIESSLKHFRGAVNYTSVDDFSTATRTGSK